ncbi:HAD family hydrolase [Gorillibacterium sp. CAU 1737]|uniref:HAD family hydrolase n=1 Tax=Gorillibacterium sp. CAU 1737 TaxID=3140362 RepID=UPI00325FF712
MRPKAILFDFDGTLADTLPVCFYSFQKVFGKYDNRTLSHEEIIQMFGPSEVGIIQQNLACKDLISEAIEDYYLFYEQEHETLVSTNEDINGLLALTRSMGIRTGVVTGKARRSYERSVMHLFAHHGFDVSVTGDDVAVPKPDPEGIRKALYALECSPQEALFVGDSNADIEAGKRANVRTVGVNRLGHSHGRDFLIKPDYEFSRVSEFIHVLLNH